MNAMLFSEINDTIDLFQRCLVDVGPVLRTPPYPIGKWDACEVESPFLHRRKVKLLKGWLGLVVMTPFPLQVESTPVRNGLDPGAKRILRRCDLRRPALRVA